MRPKPPLVRLLTPKASGIHTDPVSERQDKAPVSHPASGANTHRSDGAVHRRRQGGVVRDGFAAERGSAQVESVQEAFHAWPVLERLLLERVFDACISDEAELFRCCAPYRLMGSLLEQIPGAIGEKRRDQVGIVGAANWAGALEPEVVPVEHSEQ
jgi:hypothetical protein